MRSRNMLELTAPEIEEYLAKGNSTAILPVGCVEMHGPHQPIGTDSYIAMGFAQLLAEKGDCLMLPPVHYTWAGSTDGFPGTISIEPELVQQTVSSIALKADVMGFKRFLAVSVHACNDAPLYLFARRIYETHGIAAVYMNPYKPFSSEAGSIFAGDAGKSKEASLVLAGLHVMGMSGLYSEKEMKYNAEAVPFAESFRKIGHLGTVGYSMQDPTQHACPSEHVSLDKGLDFLQKQAVAALSLLENIDGYYRDMEKQKNAGWWRGGRGN